MLRRTRLLIAAVAALASAPLSAQGGEGAERSAALRASLQAGEQADGYMAAIPGAPRAIQDEVNAVNIIRRSLYTNLAGRRGATIQEAAATAACRILATRVQPGQYYRLPDNVWRRRNGDEPVPLPPYCG